MTLVSPRDRVDSASVTAADASSRTCPVCAHPARRRTGLARAERALLRMAGRRGGMACGAEITDAHEATSWGEPPCACTDTFHR